MTAGRLVFEAAGSASRGEMTGTVAVALACETDAGWLVDAASDEAAIDIVHEPVPRAREAWWSEFLVWTDDDYRDRHLLGTAFPASWTRVWPRRARATAAPGPGSSPGHRCRPTPIRSAAERSGSRDRTEPLVRSRPPSSGPGGAGGGPSPGTPTNDRGIAAGPAFWTRQELVARETGR